MQAERNAKKEDAFLAFLERESRIKADNPAFVVGRFEPFSRKRQDMASGTHFMLENDGNLL